MAELKYKPVSHDHERFLKNAQKREGRIPEGIRRFGRRLHPYPRDACGAFKIWSNSRGGCRINENNKERCFTPGVCGQACSIPDDPQKVCSGCWLPSGNQIGSGLLPEWLIRTGKKTSCRLACSPHILPFLNMSTSNDL